MIRDLEISIDRIFVLQLLVGSNDIRRIPLHRHLNDPASVIKYSFFCLPHLSTIKATALFIDLLEQKGFFFPDED